MAKTVCEIPFERTPSSRVLPWIVAAMVYLVLLAMGACAHLGTFVQTFQRGLQTGFTVEIESHHHGLGQDAQEKKSLYERGQAALKMLHHFPGVKSATPMGTSYLDTLISPWGDKMRDPLFIKPTMIHVEPVTGKTIDLKKLQKQLHQEVPGAVVYNAHPWKTKLLDHTWTMVLIILSFGGLICFVAVGTIVFAAHSSLLIHDHVVHVLRLIGATDRYISKQFEKYALSLAVKGSIWATLLAGGTFWVLVGAPTRHVMGGQSVATWAVLVICPLIMALFTLWCVRISISWTLVKEGV